ncbi:hypothetical protein GQ54DRAFT_253252 [Martensiomyces pterosporus]|nr:hypothetical protein GQ54DRAFT_253252 [Martensiomyces pterosporus]
MIEAALSRYASDRLGKTDFALFSAGARVIPGLTSPTFEPPVRGLAQKLWRKLGMISSHPPAAILDPNTHVGECWPMRGSSGQVAIHLAQPVDVTEFGVEHVAKSVAIDWRSAPRQIEVWGYVLGTNTTSDGGSSAAGISADPSQKPPVRTIIVKVRSNWGHPDHTCLYRFRVHGQRVPL